MNTNLKGLRKTKSSASGRYHPNGCIEGSWKAALPGSLTQDLVFSGFLQKCIIACRAAGAQAVSRLQHSIVAMLVSSSMLLCGLGCRVSANPDASKNFIAQAAKDSKETLTSEQPNLDRFEQEIADYEAADKKRPPAPGCTVFVGSSTFRFWKSLESDFAEFKAVNRGFGGSTFPDINHFVDRIVTRYNPAKVVVYAGTNDIAELHHSGEDIFHDFQEFVHKVQAKVPKAEIYFISMSMAPSRLQYADKYDKGNAFIREYIQKNKHLHYIDVVPSMHKPNGDLRVFLFGFDQLHMNKMGYALWKPIVAKALKQSI